jgi:hypothetical protein
MRTPAVRSAQAVQDLDLHITRKEVHLQPPFRFLELTTLVSCLRKTIDHYMDMAERLHNLVKNHASCRLHSQGKSFNVIDARS